MCWVSLAIGIAITALVTWSLTSIYWSVRLAENQEQALKLIERIRKNQ